MSIQKIFISLILVLSIMLPTNVYAYDSNKVQVATWLWDTQQIVKDPDGIIKFLSNNNVKTLYLQVNYDIKISEYRKFISKASAKNISVQALDGGADWIFPKGQSMQKKFFDWLTKYQSLAQPKERFKGVHLDVEPYLNPLYSISQNKAIEGYQDFLLSSINKSNTLKLPISIDTPFWFDEVKYSTKYGSGFLAEWVIKNVKDITIMAYRNSASGSNGIINLVSNEMNLAKKYKSKVTVAVETQKSSEGDYLSFYGMKQSQMNQQLNTVFNYYKGYSGFNGFAIHNVNSWMALSK